MLTSMESDQDDMLNEDEVKRLQSISQPLTLHPHPIPGTTEEMDEVESLTESDELSLIGKFRPFVPEIIQIYCELFLLKVKIW